MNDQALARYLQTCCRRLNQQQSALIKDFSLRTCADIEIQPVSGLMNLDLPGRGRAIANLTPIARYLPSSQTWCWAWAKAEPFPLHCHGDTALQSLARKTGLGLFTQAQLKLSLEQTVLLLAMACSKLKASGYYRWRYGDEFIFLAINHMALAAAPLAYSCNGDRLQLAQLNRSSKQSQSSSQQSHPPVSQTVSQLVRPSPSLLGHDSPTPAWPDQQFIEGLFIHTLCPSYWSDLSNTLVELKALFRKDTR